MPSSIPETLLACAPVVLLWVLVVWRCWPRAALVYRQRAYNLHEPPRVPPLLPLYLEHEEEPHAGVTADRRRATDTDNDREPSAPPDARTNFHVGLEAEWHE